jgi:two-component system, OmpR family, sensor histidine kinase QseC
MKPFSIRRRLLLLLLGSMVLVWLTMLGFSYRQAHEEVHELADVRLQQGARTLLLLDLKRLGRLANADSPEQRHGHHENDDAAAPLNFQIWSDDGELLLHSAGAPAAPFAADEGYATQAIGGQQWRSYTVRDARRDYQVRVGEPMRVREQLAAKLVWHLAQVLLLALPLLALLIWVSIGRGLQPLVQLSAAIATRDANKLEPIRLEQVPAEAQALTDALNQLLQRLAHSIDKERSFTADAAHELRTPLAAIKVQAEVALAAQDEASRHHAIGQVIAGVNRTTHLARQLLLLARLDHLEPAARQAVDLCRLTLEGVAQRAGDAARKGIEFDLSAQPAASRCMLQGDPAMLAILLDNLLDNAIKYGRAGGRIAVSLQPQDGALALQVADDGEGVASEERARLQDRFFRVPGHDVAGSGLGLSIVEKIAAVHGASVTIGDGLEGRGLGVTVTFRL